MRTPSFHKPNEGVATWKKNLTMHMCSNSRIMNRENPRFPEYASERSDYFTFNLNTAQGLSAGKLQALMENMCCGRQDNPTLPENYKAFMKCLKDNQVSLPKSGCPSPVIQPKPPICCRQGFCHVLKIVAARVFMHAPAYTCWGAPALEL